MGAMQLDAVFLIVITVCCLIVITEDKGLGFVTRVSLAVVGALCFAQSLWLLGVWIPNAAGFPWPRLSLDGAFALVAVLRTGAVLKQLYWPSVVDYSRQRHSSLLHRFFH